ncbi:caspase-2-like [Lingula anatina]|uniref:Caspase-2-like n=1 Tax=Lingula anatina TaxID=7574 RepID=A0A1S3KB65_LINAN|nr:caspase-2-like [Lingula anatina]|eukprot:XP_013419501.2 caspase-2-like [Lingula anatina]
MTILMTKYKNNSEPRGRALIINNKTFSVDWLPKRDGTEVDVDALRKLFSYLHYETDVVNDLTANEMKEEIEQESRRDYHKNYDSFILFLLSHGTKGAVYGTDGYQLPYKYIKTILNNKNCPGLRGKPKMIFIQACQGSKLWDIKGSGSLPDGQTIQQPQQAPLEANFGDEIPDAPHESFADPIMSDFLEVHATSPGTSAVSLCMPF